MWGRNGLTVSYRQIRVGRNRIIVIKLLQNLQIIHCYQCIIFQ